MDDKKEFFEFGIMIEEYLMGPHLSLVKGEAKEVAELLGRLHSFEPRGTRFLIWADPLVDTYKLAQNDLTLYKARRTAENKCLGLAKRSWQRSKPR